MGAAAGNTDDVAVQIQRYEELASKQKQALAGSHLDKTVAEIQRIETDLNQLSHNLIALWPTLTKLIPTEQRLRQESDALQKKVNDGSVDPATAIATLRPLKAEADRLSTELKNIADSEHYKLDDLSPDMEKMKKLGEQVDGLGKKIEPTIRELEEADAQSTDQFFIVANALRQASGEKTDLPEIGSLLRDERDRRRMAAQGALPDLSERDSAMVANVSQFCASQRQRAVAMIVGYAHLDGVAKKLQAAGFAVRGGMVAASNDEIEPWEERAWEERRKAATTIFAKRDIKELSRLLDETWKKEQIARLKFFADVNLPKARMASIPQGSARIFENIGGPKSNTVVRMGKFHIDRNARYGQHLVAMGAVPDESGAVFEVWDRSLAQTEVRELGNSQTQFAYAYQTRADGKTVTRIYTGRGAVSVDDFAENPPTPRGNNGGKPPLPPERVVLFGEPDERNINGRTVSPLHSQLRESSGGGNNGANNGNKWTLAWGAEPDPQRKKPELYYTINPKRAAERIEILDHQEPLRVDRVEYLDETSLSSLWFTPRRGDHALAFIIAGKNTPEFRAELKKAAEAGKLRNKQVALLTCFDDYAATQELKESLISEGALMVWIPDRQITPEAAEKLKLRMKKIEEGVTAGDKPRSVDQLIRRALEEWQREVPADPDLEFFRSQILRRLKVRRLVRTATRTTISRLIKESAAPWSQTLFFYDRSGVNGAC